MALVVALRFTGNSGAICMDQESWHLRNRKTFFSDSIYSLVPPGMADKLGLELIYAGVGHPSYHLEVATKSEKKIDELLTATKTTRSDTGLSGCSVQDLAEVVLDVFTGVHRRRISNRLEYLYGFNDREFASRSVMRRDNPVNINQKKVIQHSREILEGKDKTGYPPLSPAIEACLIGVDRKYGFSGFTLKETDGVLSFHSCGFDALGCGKYVAAASFAKLFNNLFLDTRRKGIGISAGLFHILDAMIEGIDHSGQVGGNIRLVMINGNAQTQKSRLSVLSQNPALLALETVRAARNQFITQEMAETYLMELMNDSSSWEKVEKDLFTDCSSPEKLDKLLRGYKLHDNELPTTSIATELYMSVAPVSLSKGKQARKGKVR